MTDLIERDGRTWVEIGRAARMSRTKAILIREKIDAGGIASLELDGFTFIPLADANRLKREAWTMTKVRNLNRKRTPLPARNFAPGDTGNLDILPTPRDDAWTPRNRRKPPRDT